MDEYLKPWTYDDLCKMHPYPIKGLWWSKATGRFATPALTRPHPNLKRREA